MIVATWKHRGKSYVVEGTVEDGLDLVAAADVERELDAGVDLRLVDRSRAGRADRGARRSLRAAESPVGGGGAAKIHALWSRSDGSGRPAPTAPRARGRRRNERPALSRARRASESDRVSLFSHLEDSCTCPRITFKCGRITFTVLQARSK